MMMKEKELLQFPCDFPIKVMGYSDPEFVGTIGRLIREFDPLFDPQTIASRPSKQGRYEALHVVVHATSKQQLDSIYMALTHHPMVKVVL